MDRGRRSAASLAIKPILIAARDSGKGSLDQIRMVQMRHRQQA